MYILRPLALPTPQSDLPRFFGSYMTLIILPLTLFIFFSKLWQLREQKGHGQIESTLAPFSPNRTFHLVLEADRFLF